MLNKQARCDQHATMSNAHRCFQPERWRREKHNGAQPRRRHCTRTRPAGGAGPGSQSHHTAIHGRTRRDPGRSLPGFYQGSRTLDELVIPWEGIGRLIPSHQQLIKVDSTFGKGPAILNKLRLGLDKMDESIPGNAAQNTLIDCCP